MLQRESESVLVRYVLPILLAGSLFLHAPHAKGDPLFDQFASAQSLKASTIAMPLVGKLILGDPALSKDTIAAALPVLQQLADSNASNPFLTFALANASRILGEKAKGESLLAVTLERGYGNAGLLLALASLYEALNLPDDEEAVFQTLHESTISSGYRSRPALGDFFCRRGMESLKKGDKAAATKEFERALRFEPRSLAENLSVIGLSVSSFQGKAASQIIELCKSIKVDFISQHILLLNLLRGLTVCLVIVAFAFLLGIVLKNLPGIQHRIYELLPSAIFRSLRNAIAWSILTLPAIWLGCVFPLLMIPVYLFATWLPAVRKEKILIFLFLCILGSVPLLLGLESTLVRPLDPHDRTSIIARAQEEGYDPSLAAELSANLQNNPSDFEMTFSLGLLQKRGGNLSDAISRFNAASNLRPRASFVRNDLGNAYFGLGDYDKAMQEYESAVNLDPRSAAPHYNMAQVYSKKLMLSRSSYELNQALKLDFGLVNEFRKISGEQLNRQVMDMTLSPSDIWRVLFRSKAERQAELIMAGFFGGHPMLLSLASIVFLLLSIFGGLVAGRAGLDTVCSVCGAQACRKCLQDGICTRCNRKMVVTESPNLKERLEQKLRGRAHRAKLLKSLILSIVLPGSGHVFLRSTWKGVAFSLVYSMALTSLLLKSLFTKISPFAAAGLWFSGTIAAVGLMVIVYVLCFRSVLRTLAAREA